MFAIIRNFFIHKIQIFTFSRSHFVRNTESNSRYTKEGMIKMLEFLVDNIFVVFAGNDFQQKIGIPMGTNCDPLLGDIFLYSHEAEYIKSLLSVGKKQHLSSTSYMDTSMKYCPLIIQTLRVIWFRCRSRCRCRWDQVTTESNTSASYLNLLLSIERDGLLRTFLSHHFNFSSFYLTAHTIRQGLLLLWIYYSESDAIFQ